MLSRKSLKSTELDPDKLPKLLMAPNWSVKNADRSYGARGAIIARVKYAKMTLSVGIAHGPLYNQATLDSKHKTLTHPPDA
jgi:hypothetical protein